MSLLLPLLLALCLIATLATAQKDGQVRIDSLQQVLKTIKPDTTRVNTLLALASAYKLINFDTSIILSREALQLSEKTGWRLGIAKSVQKMALLKYNAGNPAEALPLFIKENAAWQDLEKNNSGDLNLLYINEEKASSLNGIAASYDKLGKYQQALQYYTEALKTYQSVNNQEKVAEVLVNIGIVYSEQGLHDKSIEHYFTALTIFEHTGNKKAIAQTQGSIGIAFGEQKNYAKALEYQFKALAITESIGDKNGSGHNLSNIAMVYDNKSDYVNALNYYAKALKAAEDPPDDILKAIVLNNMGEIYNKQGELDKARGYYAQALVIFQKIEFSSGIATAMGNMGHILLKKQQYGAAEEYFKKSLAIFDAQVAQNEIMKINAYLSELYEKTGNYKSSLEHFKKSTAAKDSVFSQSKTEEITRMEMAYEQEKKDAIARAKLEKQKLIKNLVIGGVALLIVLGVLAFMLYKRRRDALQKQKETVMSLTVSQTEMKALRSQMNPHFIFNALQSIQTFIISHQSEEANTYLLKFSKLMRLVLENSLHNEVPLKADIQALELYMQLESIRLPLPFSYQFHIDEQIDTEETKIPPLILQPFVENAIWHGLQYKNEPGRIDIYLKRTLNVLQAVVEDNGVGRHSGTKMTRPAFAKKESLGIKLTEDRLKILNEQCNTTAQFTITDLLTSENEPAGTRVELTLPISI